MIPIVDLVAQYNSIKDEIDAAISRVIQSGQFILGQDVVSLEKEVAKFCDVPYAVACGSGTDGLYLSLLALGIKHGDEVITTPFSFVAAAEVISLSGARPVFVDIDPRTFNIDPQSIERAVTSRTKAIIPVHLYGQIAEMDPIVEVARRNNIKIIEDAAQALGAKYRNKNICNWGDAGVISFFPTKNLGAFGDGGMILTKDAGLAEKLKSLRNHGSRKKYVHNLIGTNSRLDTIQAAVLRVKLKYINKWNEKRCELAAIYDRMLGEAIPAKQGVGDSVTIPYKEPYNVHIYHQYTIRARERDTLKEFLQNSDIQTAIHYPLPLHLQESFQYLGYKRGDLPEAEVASSEVLSLPIYPELGTGQIQKIAYRIKEYYE